MRLHLDTDLGGDPDDVCALAMVLGWPGVEIVGVTTTGDPDGRRAGLRRALPPAGRAPGHPGRGRGGNVHHGRPHGAAYPITRGTGECP
ncbi:hypothetical protein GCM10020220_037130 [Nonomuraea rubra]|uniref:hypothetical protein n=1 Tax=Nonomuraea rubra TaxID=46180 RepID=UPI0031F06E11